MTQRYKLHIPPPCVPPHFFSPLLLFLFFLISISSVQHFLFTNGQQCGLSSVVQLVKTDQCSGPTGFTILSNGTRLVSCYTSGLVGAASGKSVYNSLIPASACFNPNVVVSDLTTDVAYIACASGGIMAMYKGVYTTLVIEPICNNPYNFQIDAARKTLYANCYQNTGATGTLIAVNITTIGSLDHLTFDGSVRIFTNSSLCYRPTNVFLDRAHQLLYATCESGNPAALEIDVRTGNIRSLLSPNDCKLPSSLYLRGENLFITCPNTGTIYVNIRTLQVQILVDLVTCPAPASVYVNPSYSVYIACYGGAVLSVDFNHLDVNPIVLASTSQCVSPYFFYIQPGTGEVYCACYGSAIIQLVQRTVTQLVSAANCPTPYQTVTTADASYVACGAGGILKVTANAVTTLVSASQCISPYGVDLSPDRTILFAVCGSDGSLGAIVSVDLNTSVVQGLASTTFCSAAYGISAAALDTQGVVYAACGIGPNSVVSVDLSGNAKVLALDRACPSGYNVMAHPNGTVWAACYTIASGQNGIIEIDPNGAITVIATSNQCKAAYGVFYNALDDSLYLSCYLSGTFRIKNGIMTTVLSIDQCPGPYGAYADSQGIMYATCSTGGALSITMSANGTASSVTPILDYAQCSTPHGVSIDYRGTILVACSNAIVAITPYQQCMGGGGLYFQGGTCLPCPINYYSPVDAFPATFCTPCPNGTTSVKETGVTQCTACSAGSYQSGSDCQLCRIGSAQSNPGSISCDTCLPGSVAPDDGATTCVACTVGHYHLAGSQTCIQCAPGSAQNSTGATVCPSCPAGSIAPGTGNSFCSECAAGRYQQGQTCIDCLPGSAQPIAGSTSCSVCQSYSFAPSTAAVTCLPCAHSVTNATGSVSCDCPREWQYEIGIGCDLCPIGKTSVGGNSQCDFCPVNTYTTTRGSGCISCAGSTGLICNGGRASVQQGYWPVLTDSIQAYSSVACPRGLCDSSILPDVWNATALASSDELTLCEYPRVNSLSNLLCAQCVTDYIPWGLECVHCTHPNSLMLLAAVTWVAVEVTVVVIGASQDYNSGAQDCLIYFIQVAALEIGPVADNLSWMEIFNFNSGSIPQCLLPLTAYEQQLIDWFMPILFFAILFVLFLVHGLMHRCWQSTASASAAPDPADSIPKVAFTKLSQAYSPRRYMVAVTGVLIFCYTQVVVSCVRYLYCIDVGSARLLYFSPTIDCNSTTYHQYLIVALTVLVGYGIGLPLFILLLLFRNRQLLNSQATEAGLRFRQKWGLFFIMYHPRAWFWQPVTLLRRGVFAIVSVFLVDQPVNRFASYCFLNFASQILQTQIQPYCLHNINSSANLSYCVLVCVSLLLTAVTPPFSVGVQVLILVMVILPICMLVFPVLSERWNARQDKKRAKRRSSIQLTKAEGDRIKAGFDSPFSPAQGSPVAGISAVTPARRVAKASPEDGAVAAAPTQSPLSQSSNFTAASSPSPTSPSASPPSALESLPPLFSPRPIGLSGGDTSAVSFSNRLKFQLNAMKLVSQRNTQARSDSSTVSGTAVIAGAVSSSTSATL